MRFLFAPRPICVAGKNQIHLPVAVEVGGDRPLRAVVRDVGDSRNVKILAVAPVKRRIKFFGLSVGVGENQIDESVAIQIPTVNLLDLPGRRDVSIGSPIVEMTFAEFVKTFLNPGVASCIWWRGA